jgi:YD repeat-containing protein
MIAGVGCTIPTGEATSARNITKGYDPASRLTSITTNGGETTVSFGYDDANRQIWEEQTLIGYPTRRVETPRDGDGNRSCLQVPGSYYVDYQYTGRNQLKAVNGFAHFAYDQAGI